MRFIEALQLKVWVGVKEICGMDGREMPAGFKGHGYGCRRARRKLEAQDQRKKAKEEAGPSELGMTSKINSPIFGSRKTGHPAIGRKSKSKDSDEGAASSAPTRRAAGVKFAEIF
jgi:hypothetical protein